MKKLVWALVLYFSFYSFSNAQMLEEGSTTETTVETEDLGEGHIDTYTAVTTTVEHATTGDILDVDNGIVNANKAGTLEIDWGGKGPIAGMVDCTEFFGADTGKCGLSTGSQLTTFEQYIDLPFTITDGGQIIAGLDFHFKSHNASGYVESKGYYEGVEQWATNQIALVDTGVPAYYSGTHNFAGGLDRVWISIGGYNQYYVDNVNYTINYNVITTHTDVWSEIIQPVIDVTNILENQYTEVTPQQDQMDIQSFDIVTTVDMPDVYEPEIIEVQIELPDINPSSNMGSVIETVETFVAEIQDIEIETPATPEIENSVEVDSTTASQPTQDAPQEEVEVAEVSTEPEATEEASNSPSEDVAENDSETKENIEVTEEKAEETETVDAKPEEKEVAENEESKSEESTKETAKEEEEKPNTEVAEKKTVKTIEEKKQEKAEKIIEKFTDNFDPVAQTATLAIISALGSDMRSYQNVKFEDAVAWYQEEDPYSDVNIPDPLGQYISLIDGVVMDRLINEAQYE